MHGMRETQTVLLARFAVEHDAAAPVIAQCGVHQCLQLGMRSAEIVGVAKRCVREASVHVLVTTGAELLCCGFHAACAFMFGMAGGTAFGAFLAEGFRHLPQQRLARAHRPARSGEPRPVGMIADVFVAGEAGFVADRDEGFDMAGLAIVLERVVRKAELAGAPTGIPCHLVDAICTGLLVLARQAAPDRYHEERTEYDEHADPCRGALAWHGTGEVEPADGVAIAEFALLLRDGDQRLAVGFASKGQRVETQRKRSTTRRIERDRGLPVPVESEVAAADCLDRQLATVAGRYRYMVLLDREVCHHNVVGRCAANAQPIAFDRAIAHDLAASSGVIDGPDEECHVALLTSNRTH